MPRQSLIVVGLLATLLAIPVRANEGQASPDASQVNLHIGGGIGVPLDPTGKFAGIGGTWGWAESWQSSVDRRGIHVARSAA